MQLLRAHPSHESTASNVLAEGHVALLNMARGRAGELICTLSNRPNPMTTREAVQARSDDTLDL